MEIRIVDNNRAQSLSEQSNFIWRLYRKKYLPSILGYFGLVTLIYIYDPISFEEPGPKATHLNSNLFETLGFVFLIYAIINLIQFLKLKFQYHKKWKIITNRYLQKDANEVYITINTTSVSYQSHFSKSEYVWEIVDGFFMKGDFIFLFVSDSIESTIIVDKRSLTPVEFSELLAFLNSKVQYKDKLV